MQSSIVVLNLQLGDSLGSEVERLAASMGLTPDEWLFLFLAKGRLTPNVESELAEARNNGISFLTKGR